MRPGHLSRIRFLPPDPAHPRAHHITHSVQFSLKTSTVPQHPAHAQAQKLSSIIINYHQLSQHENTTTHALALLSVWPAMV